MDFIKIAKGGLISEGFSLRLQYPIEDAKPLSSVKYLKKEKMLIIVLKIGAKVENFLILSHFYILNNKN